MTKDKIHLNKYHISWLSDEDDELGFDVTLPASKDDECKLKKLGLIDKDKNYFEGECEEEEAGK
jgi:hypothetical protein